MTFPWALRGRSFLSHFLLTARSDIGGVLSWITGRLLNSIIRDQWKIYIILCLLRRPTDGLWRYCWGILDEHEDYWDEGGADPKDVPCHWNENLMAPDHWGLKSMPEQSHHSSTRKWISVMSKEKITMRTHPSFRRDLWCKPASTRTRLILTWMLFPLWRHDWVLKPGEGRMKDL